MGCYRWHPLPYNVKAAATDSNERDDTSIRRSLSAGYYSYCTAVQQTFRGISLCRTII